MAKNFGPNPSKDEPQNPHYHPQYNWHPHRALDSQSKTIATHQYNKTWNSRYSHLARQYPDAPAYGPFLIYITDKVLWRERGLGIDGGFVRVNCVGDVDSVDVIVDVGWEVSVWIVRGRGSVYMLKGRNLGRKERDVELEVGGAISDPDIPTPSIETDGEICSSRMNIGTGKEDTIKLGGIGSDSDIPIPSIELDGHEFIEEEESEGSLVELQNGNDERHLIEEENNEILEARARDRYGAGYQDRMKLGRNHRQHLLTTSRGQTCLREAVPSSNIT
ncbi:hypothetical protein BPAE_0218g00060 [Botrytis paeoniae]|uniref:Uncharacterized protein n=1 Tax=Botrytis paeoniae TaxID=278948 RepID=A0A4Z1FDT5_9HELO|nr:hypothetical protein BPAE_0218g00060 [Botrytis paeoniae]